MNKFYLRYPAVLGALLLTVLFFGFSPAKASAYTCSVNTTVGSVNQGGTAKATVTVSGVTDPVYVFAKSTGGGNQSIDGCTQDASLGALGYNTCADPNLFVRVTSNISLNVNSLTSTLNSLGAHTFDIFCSTNRPVANYSEGSGANNAQNVQEVTSSYTITGGQDCELAGVRIPGDILYPPTFNGSTIPPNYSLAKSSSKSFNITNSGSQTANLSINSLSANVTASLVASTLAPLSSTQLTINFNGSASHETFNLVSSCGAVTHTYPLTGETPAVFTPPPPPPPSNECQVGDYPIVVAGDPLVITEGQTITRDVVVGNPNGRTENIKIIAERIYMPPGVNVTFSQDSYLISTGSSFRTTATFKADGLVLAGSYNYQLGIGGCNHSSLIYSPLKMTTKNKVIPAKDIKDMPATVNTLRTYEAKMTNLRLESPGDYGRLYQLPSGWTDPYTAAAVGGRVMTAKNWATPVLIMDKNAGRGIMGARYYSLADPMNPVRDFSKDKTLNNTPAGDYGPQMYPYSIAYSRNGQYELSNQHNNGTIGSTPQYPVNGPDTGVRGGFLGLADEGNLLDIFESNPANPSKSYVYFTSLNRGGIYRLDGVTREDYVGAGGSKSFVYTEAELPFSAPNIPQGTGNAPGGMGVHTTVMSGPTKDYVAALTGPGDYRSVRTPTKLSIYSATESDPVAEINITAPTSTQYLQNMTSFVTADVEYVMFTYTLPLLPITAKPGDADYYKQVGDPKRTENLLYVYKFDPATNALTKIAENIKFVGQTVAGTLQSGLAGIRVGKKDGLIMLLYDDMSKADPNPNPAYSPRPSYKPVIFMFADLSAGRLKDVFQDAGYSINPVLEASGEITSVNVGVSTYVYLNTQQYGISAYKGAGNPDNNASYGIAVLRFGPSGVNVTPVTPSPSSQHKACVSNSCTLVSGAGVDSCSGDADCASTPPGGGGGGGGAPAGSCDFTLTPSPASVDKTVPSGQSSYISIGLSSSKPADTSCPAVTISLTTLRDGSGNTVATPLSSNLTISPGNSTVAIYNVSKFPGSYTLTIKAYGRNVQKTLNVPLNVQ